MNRILTILAFMFFATGYIVAQTTIEGKVKDKETNEEIISGSVKLLRGGVLISGTATDFDGRYFFNDVQPGNYSLEVSYIGFSTKIIENVVIKAGRTNRIDVELSTDAKVLATVEIVEYKVPIIEIDNTTQGTVVTAEKIRALPTKQINAIAATAAGASSRDGGEVSFRGSRSNETVYFLDGVRVTGNMIPQSEIEQLQVIVGGIEARYGDVTGGAISLTSRGPSNKVIGTFEAEKSFDGYGYNLLSGNIAGPILKNKNNQSILGYRFSGQYRDVKDNSPSAVGVYRAPEDVIRRLESNPLYFVGSTSFPSAELLRNSDIGSPFKARPNNENIDLDLTGRIDIKLSKNFDVQLSGNYNDNKNRFTPNSSGVSGSGASWAMFNWVNNPFQYRNTYRGNLRITHKLGSQSIDVADDVNPSNLRNFQYTLTLGYQKSTNRTEDFRHQDRLFNYGYYGETQRNWVPVFGFFDENDPRVFSGFPFGHVGYQESIGEYTPNTVINPVLGSFNAINGVNVNGLLDQNKNTVWGSLFANVGQVYNNFLRREGEIYSLNLMTGFDLFPGGSSKGRHNIQLGFIYEQSINRDWNLRPFDLWNLADIASNQHINGLDTSVILRDTMIAGVPYPVPIYQTKIDIEQDNKFYRSVRNLTGASDNSYANVWSIAPDRLTLDMFSASEVINRQNLISYYGYDYLGNKVGSDVTFDDFFRSTDKDNKRTFLVAPQRPIYGAVFLQDKFSYKDIIFRVGARVDYFDANTRVLRDPYALYEIESAKDYFTRTGKTQPASVGDDYNVYVESEESEQVVAFRKGDQWFLPNGTAVSGGNIIYQGGLVFPSYAGKDNNGVQTRILDIRDPRFDVNHAFVDYKPQINFMPRLAFSFPISEDAGFFAHYDVLYQRPPSNSFASGLDYFFFDDISRVNPGGSPINNPNLRPVRTVDYEVGFQQKITETMGMKLSAYYKEARDLIQQRVFANVAAPLNEYKVFDNLDFSTIKGFSIGLDRRRTNNLEMNLTYTLQFADGSGSDANSSNNINNRGPIRNLLPLNFDERHRFTGVLDYRYGSGSSFVGPQVKIAGHNILEDFGINVIGFLVSGQPYTRNAFPGERRGDGFLGSINGARLPWNFTADLNLQKRLPVALGSEGKRKVAVNAYLRVQNVFNNKNTINVFGFTGDPESDGYLQSSFGIDRQRGVTNSGRDVDAFLEAYSWRLLSPGNFNFPRRLYVGVILDFNQ